MPALKRKFPGGTTGAAISLALALCTSPLAAQRTILTVAGGAITFNAQTGASRTTTVSVRSTSASLGGGKVIGDLQWRRSDLAVWNSMTLTDAQVEQRVQVRNGANDPWSNTIFFRMLLTWTTDAPATYSANYQITLSQTVP